MTIPKVYLAGPEVFLSNALDTAARKKELCRRHGLEGQFPFDAEIEQSPTMTPLQHARRISEQNERLMRSSDCVVANCTPFRGASMDIGTGYEIGFMRGLGKPVFGYTNVTASYKDRADHYAAVLGPDSLDAYTAGTDIENFGLFENLMIDIALRNFDCEVVCRGVAPGAELTDLDGFDACLAQAASVPAVLN